MLAFVFITIHQNQMQQNVVTLVVVRIDDTRRQINSAFRMLCHAIETLISIQINSKYLGVLVSSLYADYSDNKYVNLPTE